MDEIKYLIGAITNKEIKEGITNEKAWKRCIFTIGDNFKVSSFHQDTISAYNVGDIVKAAYKTEGQYNNLVGFDDPTADEVTRDQTVSKQPEQSSEVNRQKMIIRQNCNERAIQLLEVIWEHAPQRVDEVLAVNNDLMAIVDTFANHFEARVWREL